MASACSPRASSADRLPNLAPCQPRVTDSNVGGGDPVRPEIRAACRSARGKRLRGAVCFVETVNLSRNRARPGRSAPSLTVLFAQAAKSHAATAFSLPTFTPNPEPAISDQ